MCTLFFHFAVFWFYEKIDEQKYVCGKLVINFFYSLIRSQKSRFFFIFCKFMAKFYIKSDFQFQFLMLMSKWGHFLDVPIRACINVMVVGMSKQLIPTWEIILKQNIYTWNWYANFVIAFSEQDLIFKCIWKFIWAKIIN